MEDSNDVSREIPSRVDDAAAAPEIGAAASGSEGDEL